LSKQINPQKEGRRKGALKVLAEGAREALKLKVSAGSTLLREKPRPLSFKQHILCSADVGIKHQPKHRG